MEYSKKPPLLKFLRQGNVESYASLGLKRAGYGTPQYNQLHPGPSAWENCELDNIGGRTGSNIYLEGSTGRSYRMDSMV